MSLGKFQNQGIKYLNSLPNVICKCIPPQLPLVNAAYIWHLDDMDSDEYFARMSEIQSSFVVLTHCGFYKIGHGNKLYTSGWQAVWKMHDLKIAVDKILQEIKMARKDRAEFIKGRKTIAIVRAAERFET